MVVCSTLVLVCCAIITQGSFVSAAPRVLAPTSIEAFSYDVAVHVKDATVGDVVQLFRHNQTEAITAQVITKTSQTSTLIFNCGYFFETGGYFFKVLSPKGDVLTSSSPLTATEWPKFEITWGKHHEALTTDVKVSMSVSGIICKSDIARQKNLSLRLRRLSDETKDSGPVRDGKNDTRIFPLMKSSENFIPSYFVIPCEMFKIVGDYQVELIVTSSTNDVIAATSDVMNVEWSKEYNLKIPKTSFPCQGTGVNVFLSFPPCASENDSVRLISITNETRKLIDTQIRGDKDHVTFPCEVFYNVNQAVDGFCFEYVVEAGHVTRTVCQPANQGGFTISGSWSPWTSWSTCQRPCLNDLERRKRLCNDPRPRGDGEQCADTNGEASLDELQFNDVGAASECGVGSKVSQLITSFEEKCECGCEIPEAEQGAIVTSLTKDCEKSRTLIWTVTVPEGYVIRFRLSDHQLAKDEVLTVRDRRTSWPLTSQFPTVTSRNNVVVIQWVKSRILHNLKSCGFILSYEAVVKPTSKTSTSIMKTNSSIGSGGLVGIGGWFENAIIDNPVVIGGISACALIIMVVVIVVAIHCRRKRKTKIPTGCQTPMNTRLSMPPDGRSCSNEDTESEPMVRPRPIGTADNSEMIDDTCIQMQPSMNAGTAYYLAQRQLELMKRLGKDEHSQTYATGCLSEENLRQQEELLFGDRKSLHKSEELRVC